MFVVTLTLLLCVILEAFKVKLLPKVVLAVVAFIVIEAPSIVKLPKANLLTTSEALIITAEVEVGKITLLL